jgi:cystathionine beta-lyase/cystathionine gamma-synthase
VTGENKIEKPARSYPSTRALEKSFGQVIQGKPEKFYAEPHGLAEFEEKMAEFLGEKEAIILNTGMSAINAAIIVACEERRKELEKRYIPRENWGLFHFIVSKNLYHHTEVLFNQLAGSHRIETTVVDDPTDPEQVRAAKKRNTIGYLFETTSNSFSMGIVPGLKEFEEVLGPKVKLIADISLSPTREVSKEVEEPDNLLTVLSGTKDLTEGKLMAGVLAGGSHLKGYRDTLRRTAGLGFTTGKPVEPLIEGLKTFNERFEASSRNALMFAQRLHEFSQEHSKIPMKVSYPGLENHPQHHLVEKSLGGNAGGILFVDFASRQRAAALVDYIAKLSRKAIKHEHEVKIGTSFGTPETRLFPLSIALPPEMGGVVRVSAGSVPIESSRKTKKFLMAILERMERFFVKSEKRKKIYAKTSSS